MKILLTFLFFPFVAINMAICQNGGSMSAAAPVTPNTAALFKSMQMPTGEPTGIPNINFPIYSSENAGPTVGINLSYNAGGIKVEEIASWVGLGWNLRVGGRISRVVKNLPDDAMGGFLTSTYKIYDFDHDTEGGQTLAAFKIAAGELDFEPDIYYYEFNGQSGKFFFDASGNVVLANPDKVTIKPVVISNGQSGVVIAGWTLVDEYGTKYYFGVDSNIGTFATDHSKVSFGSVGNLPAYPKEVVFFSSWHLVEVNDINGKNSIRYEYDSSDVSFHSWSSSYAPLVLPNVSDCPEYSFYSDEIIAYNEVNEKYLKKITLDGQTINFFLSSRIDYMEGRKLDSICRRNRSNEIIERIKFNYDYFTATNIIPINNLLCKRLKLKSYVIASKNSSDSIEYKFNYNEAVNLPDRLCKGVDYWGFYNGKDYNSTLLPNGTFNLMGQTVIRNNLGNRQANFWYSPANILTKITFPTGGYREFVYEGHTALKEHSSIVESVNPEDYTIHEISRTDLVPGINYTEPAFEDTFTVNSHNLVTNLNISLTRNLGLGNAILIKLIKIIDGWEYDEGEYINDISIVHELSNGHYKVQLYFVAPTTVSWLHINWTDYHPNLNHIHRGGRECWRQNVPAGGCRIKEVIDFDPVTSKQVKTKYEYNLFSDSLLSSGLSGAIPVYAHLNTCEISGNHCRIGVLSSHSNYPLSENSNSVMYTDVRVLQDGLGRKDLKFSYVFDKERFPDMGGYPIIPLVNQEYKRGKLLEESVYNENGDLVQKKSNDYWGFDWVNTIYAEEDTLFGKSVKGLKMATLYRPSSGNDLCWRYYDLRTQYTVPIKTTDIFYGGNGEVVKTETDLAYIKARQIPFLKRATSQVNHNKLSSTAYYYPFETIDSAFFPLSSLELVARDSLNRRSFLAHIQSQRKIVNNNILSVSTGTKTSHALSGGNILQSMSSSFINSINVKSTEYERYDQDGNVLQVKEPELRTSVIRNLDKEIICRAENVDSSQIAYTSFEDSEKGNWSFSGQPQVSLTASTGSFVYSLENSSGLSKAGLNSAVDYVVSYWSMNSTPCQVTGTKAGYPVRAKQINGWNYFEHKVSDQTVVNVSGNAVIDELRLYPVGSVMKTYTYKPLVGMSSECDVNNSITYYEYDGFNRLVMVRDHNKKILRKICYNYNGQPIDCN